VPQAAGLRNWMHPEAQLLIERSVSGSASGPYSCVQQRKQLSSKRFVLIIPLDPEE